MAPLPKANQPDPVPAEGHINTALGCAFILPHLLQMPGLQSIKKLFEASQSASLFGY